MESHLCLAFPALGPPHSYLSTCEGMTGRQICQVSPLSDFDVVTWAKISVQKKQLFFIWMTIQPVKTVPKGDLSVSLNPDHLRQVPPENHPRDGLIPPRILSEGPALSSLRVGTAQDVSTCPD